MWGNKRGGWLSDMTPQLWPHRYSGSRVRVWPLTVFVIGVGLLLIFRLAQLTLIEGKWRRTLADENRIFTLPLMAQRGILTDRNGIPLTRNVPLYRRQVPGTNPAEFKYEPVDRETALTLLTDPNEKVSFDVGRQYPCGEACAPVIGYVSEVTGDDLQDHQEYRVGELVGKIGAEKAMERLLRGQPGEEYLEINARGKAVRSVGIKQPQSGNTVKTTIDVGLQQVLYQAFEGKSGAAVAIVPQTGEILALVSSPTYDPEHLRLSLTKPGLPFFNRALGGTYAPGSTFKIVTAMAALEEKTITTTTLFEDTGEINVGGSRFGNWLYDEHGRTEGAVDVTKALTRSNDIFFYHAGESVGPEKMGEWAANIGYGKLWNLSAWGETAGLVPTPAWKLASRGERWYLGNTYHMAIGQGDVLATPLQVTVMTGAIAARGVVCPPRFVIGESPIACQQLNLHDQTIDTIISGMIGACQPGGTGVPFFKFSPQVACKTGTAQQGGEKDLPHAWFTVFAPADNPTIALTVLVENGGQGSEVAAPIAKKGIEYWLSK